MLRGGRAHHRPHLGQGNKVGEQQMRDDRGDDYIKRVLESDFEKLSGRERCGGERPALQCIAFDQALNPSINVIEKHRVRAGPAAPDAPQ